MSERRSHWTHAGLTFVLTVLAAAILLPLVRVQPKSVHEYFNGVNEWIRISFTFSLCVVFTGVMFKLLSPRVGHLAHWKAYPPAWLATLLAWFVVAVVDVSGGLNTNGGGTHEYRVTVWEWLGYGGGSLLLVGWYSGLWSEIVRQFRKPESEQAPATDGITLQDIENAPWEKIEAWLESDEPAQYDFLGNQSVAHRVSFRITEGTRSIGIVGPFGAGKTSIVSWVTDRLKRHEVDGRRFFVCHHSCWGFETSASAIHDMLGSAVSKLSEEIDTFQVDSLPESYRQTFSAGGDWVETISNLVLRTPDPMEQFSRLSSLLGDIRGRLIFIVEDLDRNETRNFEIQEVLAFLERIKPCPNLSFILTGGLSSSLRIDYAKLCDHIEYLKSVDTTISSQMVTRVCERCLDLSIFPHVPLGDRDRKHVWNPLTGILMRDYEELSLPQSVASLLNTPRSLRHALGRTFTSWHTLCGEIDLNHLVAVNVLRFGAPEAFLFLMRRWDRLHAPPTRDPSFGRERLEKIKKALIDDWNRTIERVDWNPQAALMVMEHILPAIENWFSDRSGFATTSVQGVEHERYWRRAINDSLDANEVRDQEVILDLKEWCESHDCNAKLVERICASQAYSRIWELLGHTFLGNKPDDILLLCKQVIDRACAVHGPAASGGSQGVDSVRLFAQHYVSLRKENQSWLKDRITDSSATSLQMATDLWHQWGSGQSILLKEDQAGVRGHLAATLRSRIVDADTLLRLLDSQHPYVLYQIVFDFGEDKSPISEVIGAWGWLSPILVDALRKRSATVAAAVSVLVATRESGSRKEPWTVNPEMFCDFFGGDAEEVVECLAELTSAVASEQALVVAIVDSARLAILARDTTSGGLEADAD